MGHSEVRSAAKMFEECDIGSIDLECVRTNAKWFEVVRSGFEVSEIGSKYPK